MFAWPLALLTGPLESVEVPEADDVTREYTIPVSANTPKRPLSVYCAPTDPEPEYVFPVFWEVEVTVLPLIAEVLVPLLWLVDRAYENRGVKYTLRCSHVRA